MRWIALILVAAVIAIFWAMSGDRQPDATGLEVAPDGWVRVDRDDETARAVNETGTTAVSATADVDTQHVIATEPPTRPLPLYDEVLSEASPIEPGGAGAIEPVDRRAGSSSGGLTAVAADDAGSSVPPELQGPGGDPIAENDVGPGQALSGQDSAFAGPEFDDPVSLAPEFEAVDFDNSGPGATVTTEPLPGPGAARAVTWLLA